MNGGNASIRVTCILTIGEGDIVFEAVHGGLILRHEADIAAQDRLASSYGIHQAHMCIWVRTPGEVETGPLLKTLLHD